MVNKKPHFNVAAGLIWRNGKVLISKRPKGAHLEDLWEFPGGKQESGESLESCLEREIEEELGLTVKADKALLKVDHEYGSRAISLHIFNCRLLSGEPRALGCQEIRWIYPQDFPRFNFPPPDKKVIDFISSRSGG